MIHLRHYHELYLFIAHHLFDLLNKDPLTRYSSMDLAAEDLERYLEGKPIAARRRSTWAHATSWCQRNKVVATLGTTVFLALLTILGITLWSRHKLSLALKENEISRQREATAHQQSMSNYWDAMIAQARAQQATGRVGQRVQSLSSVNRAQTFVRTSRRHT